MQIETLILVLYVRYYSSKAALYFLFWKNLYDYPDLIVRAKNWSSHFSIVMLWNPVYQSVVNVKFHSVSERSESYGSHL